MKRFLLLVANGMRTARVYYTQEQHVQMLGGKIELGVLKEPQVFIMSVGKRARSQTRMAG